MPSFAWTIPLYACGCWLLITDISIYWISFSLPFNKFVFFIFSYSLILVFYLLWLFFSTINSVHCVSLTTKYRVPQQIDTTVGIFSIQSIQRSFSQTLNGFHFSSFHLQNGIMSILKWIGWQLLTFTVCYFSMIFNFFFLLFFRFFFCWLGLSYQIWFNQVNISMTFNLFTIFIIDVNSLLDLISVFSVQWTVFFSFFIFRLMLPSSFWSLKLVSIGRHRESNAYGVTNWIALVLFCFLLFSWKCFVGRKVESQQHKVSEELKAKGEDILARSI